MGAESFTCGPYRESRLSADAFSLAVKEAQYEHGHGGYTGTIAEKDHFMMMPLSTEVKTIADVYEAADRLIDEHPKISDKWGPAGCFDVTEIDDMRNPDARSFIFFGVASS